MSRAGRDAPLRFLFSARAGLCSCRGGRCGWLERRALDQAELALLEAADAVAYGRGALELKILRGGAHLLFELGHGHLEIFLAGNVADGVVTEDRNVIGLDDPGELHVDGLDDR